MGLCKVSGSDSLPKPRTPEEAFLEVTKKSHIESIASIDYRKQRIKGKVKDDKIKELKVESLFQGQIKLTTDAKDRDGDGIPELPADGSSTAKIKANIYNLQGRVMKGKSVKVRFRVSRGAISMREGQTKDGVVEVELMSSVETTQSRIIATADAFESDAMIFEFIPVKEFQMFTKGKKKK